MRGPQWQGILLFLFIPLVLLLYTYHPQVDAWLGVHASLALGIVVMFSHRLIAVPYMMRTAHAKCVWCDAVVGSGRLPLIVKTRAGDRPFICCDDRCAEQTRRFCHYADANRLWLRLGIFVPLVYYLVVSLSAQFGGPAPSHRFNLIVFQGGIALTVVSTAILFRRMPPALDPLQFPFPIHNLYLLGIKYTLGVFAVMGGWWLIQTARRIYDWVTVG